MVSVPLSAITYLSRCSRGDCIWLWQRDEAGSGRTRRWKAGRTGMNAIYQGAISMHVIACVYTVYI